MPISDRRIFELWRERERMDARAKRATARKTKIDEALLAEFERRGIDSLTERGTGQRITYIAAEKVVYFEDQLRRRLALSAKGRTILKRCMVDVLDMKAIASEVIAGNIPPRIAAACSEVKTSAPYLKGGGGGE